MSEKPMNMIPIYEGPGTRVWLNTELDQGPFGLSTWVVHAPWVHPAWNYHLCSLIHLRDVEGYDPAKIQFEGATHEFLVLALDPKVPVDFKEPKCLTPPSIAQQFKENSDTEALEKIEILLQQVAIGHLSIDEDDRRRWKHLLKDSKLKELHDE